MRIPALHIMLALIATGAAPAMVHAGTSSTTSTTTTTTGSTTTTTLACTSDPTFVSIICRLDALSARVDAATDLGRLKNGLSDAVGKADDNTHSASNVSGKKAGKQLKHAIRRMIGFVHRLSSHSGKKVIPAETRTSLSHDGNDVLDDMKALLNTL